LWEDESSSEPQIAHQMYLRRSSSSSSRNGLAVCVVLVAGWVLDGAQHHMHAATQQQLLEQKTISLIAQPFIGSS
jgi:hypothetical protein